MNPKSIRSRIAKKARHRMQVKQKAVSNLSAPIRRYVRQALYRPQVSSPQVSSHQVSFSRGFETFDEGGRSYIDVVNPSNVLQAKRNVYQNLKNKDIRSYKKEKLRQLLAIALDYEVFRLEHSESRIARIALAIYRKKLEFVDFVHQISCDIRALTTAIY